MTEKTRYISTPHQNGEGVNGLREDASKDKWGEACKLFPKSDFPWDVLPKGIAESLQQLARSCATSANALPGTAIAILASALGATVSVLAKESFDQPLIFWFADIRDSGEGKTPPMRKLCKVLYDAQEKANENYKLAMNEWRNKRKEERGAEPSRPRSYFITDLTLEGLRGELSGHGGIVCIMNEISAFLTGQNQYKSKGSDRESWLVLHDGDPSHTVRSSGSITINKARISIVGGIQPTVWKKIFGGDDGFYIMDGTVFRFLPTYENIQFHELTEESWSIGNQQAWEEVLKRALIWADDQTSSAVWQPMLLSLDEQARDFFFDWRNGLYSFKPKLPKIINGFLSKLVGYALRFTGVIHCMDQFAKGEEPSKILTRSDVGKGIEVAMFYLGHIVDASRLLFKGNTIAREELTFQRKHLAQTLELLKPELENSRLAIGYIHEKFNETCNPLSQIKSAKFMGSLLKQCGLTKLKGKFRANGRSGIVCFLWDEKAENFIKDVNNVLNTPEGSAGESFDRMTFDEPSLECPTDDQLTEDIKDMPKDMSVTEEQGWESIEGHQGHNGHVSIASADEQELEANNETF